MNRSKLREIEQLIDELNQEDQLLLIEHIAERLRQKQAQALKPLLTRSSPSPLALRSSLF